MRDYREAAEAVASGNQTADGEVAIGIGPKPQTYDDPDGIKVRYLGGRRNVMQGTPWPGRVNRENVYGLGWRERERWWYREFEMIKFIR